MDLSLEAPSLFSALAAPIPCKILRSVCLSKSAGSDPDGSAMVFRVVLMAAAISGTTMCADGSISM